MSKKEEQSEAYIKPIILDRNKKYLKEDKWKLGLDYADFTGYEVQCAFEDGWDTAKQETIECLKTILSLRSDVHPVASEHIIELVERAMEE